MGDNQQVDWARLDLTIGRRIIGDANYDGHFTSSDLVSVFNAGEYEDSLIGNSTWTSGDWNGDGEFSSSDLVLAFIQGEYESNSPPAVPEPQSLLPVVIACLTLRSARRLASLASQRR